MDTGQVAFIVQRTIFTHLWVGGGGSTASSKIIKGDSTAGARIR